MTSEGSKVIQESEASSKAESPGFDEKSETSMESEQKDLTENLPESSQVPSQKLEEEQCDKSLPQESISPTDSKSPENSQDQNSLTPENSENSKDSSSEKTEAEGRVNLRDSSPTQSDQSPKESTEESNASPSREEEEQMNVDNGVDSEKCEDKPESSANEPKNGAEDPPISADSTQTEETAPPNKKEEKKEEKTEEGRETPMEED